jgi:hypothetical protein
MMTIADLRLSSTAPQRRRQSVCRQRWPSFATLPTDCYWGVNAAVPYCGCILIPLLPVGGQSVVGRWSVGNKGCRALGGSLQKDKEVCCKIFHFTSTQKSMVIIIASPARLGCYLLRFYPVLLFFFTFTVLGLYSVVKRAR